MPDVDVYRVDAPAGRTLRFSVQIEGVPDVAFLDIFYNYTASQAGITIRPGGSWTNEFMTGDQPLFINVVQPALPDGTPVPYELRCREMTEYGIPPVNSTAGAATTVQVGQWFSGTAGEPVWPRWIKTQVRAGQVIAFDRESSGRRLFDSRVPPVLYFDRPTRSNTSFSYPIYNLYSALLPGGVVPADGFILGFVPTLPDARARFRVLSPPPDPDSNTFFHPTNVVFAEGEMREATISGTLQNDGDVDYFLIDLPNDHRLLLSSDIQVRILEPDGTTLFIGGGNSLSLRVQQPGIHRVVVAKDPYSVSTSTNYLVTVRDLGPFPGALPAGAVPLTVGGAWVERTLQTSGYAPDVVLSIAAGETGPLRLIVEADAATWPSVFISQGFYFRTYVGAPAAGTTGTASRTTIIRPLETENIRIDLQNYSAEPSQVRVRVERVIEELDDFPDSPQTAPLLPLGQRFPSRFSRLGDIDVARFPLMPGRAYSSLAPLDFDGEVQTTTYAAPPDYRYRIVVDRPTIAASTIRDSDGDFGVFDTGPVPSAVSLPSGPLQPNVAQSFATFGIGNSRNLSLATELARIYELTTSVGTFTSQESVNTSAPWPASTQRGVWFQTPTRWGNPPLRTYVDSYTGGQTLSVLLREISAPPRLHEGVERPLPLGHTEWAYTDSDDTPGVWTVNLQAGHLYMYFTASVPGIYVRNASAPRSSVAAGFSNGWVFRADSDETLRISGPLPGSAASVRVVDFGLAPDDDIPSQIQAKRLVVGQNTDIGVIEHGGDTDWFYLSTERPRRVLVTVSPTGQNVYLVVRKSGLNYQGDSDRANAILTPGESTSIAVSYFSGYDSTPLLPAPIPYSIIVTPVCDADIAGANQSLTPDGQLTADDLIVFLNAYLTGQPRGDIAGSNQDPYPDNQFTADDLIAYINAFFAGC